MPTFQLKNNRTATDIRLGRIPQWDLMNELYPMRRVFLPTTEPRSYTWPVGRNASSQLFLNQGDTPRCVGYSLAHELAAKPVIVPDIDSTTGDELYRGAQDNDEWPGCDYDGSSVLGGMKYATSKGFYKSYTWTKNARELAVAISRHGPCPLGINWYEQMFDVLPSGFIRIGGDVAGGHAILGKGYSVRRDAFLLHNSWGREWGVNGCAWVSFPDMQRLLDEDGEACLPLRKPYTEAVIW